MITENPSHPHALRDFAQFVRTHHWKILAISVLLLIPSFWHRHLGACDLASHTYNAWLASLVTHGQAPGLYLVNQKQDVLFDLALLKLGMAFGWTAGERIAVCLAVLIFFWGAFAFLAAASRRAPWFLVPAIAMVAYGWTLQIGFMNYYLGIGFAFWGAAVLWHARGREFLLALILLPLAFVAHPLAFALLLGLFIYVRISELLPKMWKLAVFVLSLILVVVFGAYLAHHYNGRVLTFDFLLNGADQLVLAARYTLLAEIALAAGAIFFLIDAAQNGKTIAYWHERVIPIGLYVISWVATIVLPDYIEVPKFPFPITQLVVRLTLVCAVLALCVLACIRLRLCHLATFAVLAAIFFAFLWSDTGKLSAMETQAENLVAKVPANERVLATIWPLPGSRMTFINHMVDRACIAHCFSFSNYEASSRQFRLRAETGNGIVTSSPEESNDMQMGRYVVQLKDLPIYQIEQCTPDPLRLCIVELHAGEVNGALVGKLH
jgi:hypothetical protein